MWQPHLLSKDLTGVYAAASGGQSPFCLKQRPGHFRRRSPQAGSPTPSASGCSAAPPPVCSLYTFGKVDSGAAPSFSVSASPLHAPPPQKRLLPPGARTTKDHRKRPALPGSQLQVLTPSSSLCEREFHSCLKFRVSHSECTHILDKQSNE